MTILVTPEHLRARASRYLRSHSFSGTTLRDYLRNFQALGSVAVFGGFARDMALRGAAGFRSDIDIVVECESGRLHTLIDGLAEEGVTVTRNKFDGFRIHDTKNVLDVWALETTWAVRMGYVDPVLRDLPRSTFFNWDAIAYCISTRELICSPLYFEQARDRLLDLNLRENPNPKGMCVRTLRSLRRSGANLSRNLVAYVLEQDFSPEELVGYEGAALTLEFVSTCLSRMQKFMHSPASRFVYQNQLPLELGEQA